MEKKLKKEKGKDVNLVCVNKTGIEDNKIKRDASKYTKINDLLNQEFDSESSDNKLLFNEKKKIFLKVYQNHVNYQKKYRNKKSLYK